MRYKEGEKYKCLKSLPPIRTKGKIYECQANDNVLWYLSDSDNLINSSKHSEWEIIGGRKSCNHNETIIVPLGIGYYCEKTIICKHCKKELKG